MNLTERQVANFWAKINRHGVDECWPWIANFRPKVRYGYMSVNGRYYCATHIALFLDGRPRPTEQSFALHSCGNRACCNPRHLRWGSHLENMEDAYAAKTIKRTFSDDEVRAVRRDTRPLRVIAEEYGCTESCVSLTRNRHRYAYVDS